MLNSINGSSSRCRDRKAIQWQ